MKRIPPPHPCCLQSFYLKMLRHWYQGFDSFFFVIVFRRNSFDSRFLNHSAYCNGNCFVRISFTGNDTAFRENKPYIIISQTKQCFVDDNFVQGTLPSDILRCCLNNIATHERFLCLPVILSDRERRGDFSRHIIVTVIFSC